MKMNIHIWFNKCQLLIYMSVGKRRSRGANCAGHNWAPNSQLASSSKPLHSSGPRRVGVACREGQTPQGLPSLKFSREEEEENNTRKVGFVISGKVYLWAKMLRLSCLSPCVAYKEKT